MLAPNYDTCRTLQKKMQILHRRSNSARAAEFYSNEVKASWVRRALRSVQKSCLPATTGVDFPTSSHMNDNSDLGQARGPSPAEDTSAVKWGLLTRLKEEKLPSPF